MRVSERIHKTVAFVGTVRETGVFEARGTAFIVATFIVGHPFQTLVAAKHVLDGIQTSDVAVRLNDKSGLACVLPTRRTSWVPHPNKNHDICVCPTGIPHEQFDILHLRLESDEAEILTKDIIDARSIGIGDEVCIAGMFVSRLGESKNIPILRTGIISAMPDEPIKTQYGYHDAYLIEARSIDGLSGSPVFVHLPPFRAIEGKVSLMHGKSMYLMGMLLGTHDVWNAEDSIRIDQQAGAPAQYPDNVVKNVSLINTGIGIVVPVAAVIEAVNQDAIVKGRRAALAQPKDPNRRYSPSGVSAAVTETSKTGALNAPVRTSARKARRQPARAVSEAPASDNSTHKEDFTNLLRAAAKGPKRGRKT